MSDDTYTLTLETMAGSCEMCQRDFSMWRIGVFSIHQDEDDEPIDEYYECFHCGYREG